MADRLETQRDIEDRHSPRPYQGQTVLQYIKVTVTIYKE